jgi:IMP dehydrogenase
MDGVLNFILIQYYFFFCNFAQFIYTIMKNLSDKIISEALTFDDVLLVPAYSKVLPRDVNIATRLTRNIKLNTPIVSAAMDTVTEATMAIAIAREGGIGVVHKNMSIEDQAKHVKSVKRAENGMIYDPITIKADASVNDAMNLMKEYKIGGIPVVDAHHKLVGIVTNRDLRFEHEMGRRIQEVMTSEHIITTGQETNLEKAADILQKHKIEKLPVVDEHNRLIGLITYKDITKAKDRPNACKDSMGRLRVAAAVGTAADTFERIDALVRSDVDAIVIDTAHGHSVNVIETLKRAKKNYSNLEIIVGNIATAEAATDLLRAGADGVKVGIGPGSICTTRVIAGVGVPQLSAVYNVASALKGTGLPIIADGGIRYSGDIVKAIAAGASSVMAGSLFAGVEESPGETIIYNGRKYKSYRGMGSIEAMQHGSSDRYFQDDEEDIRKLVPEGIVAQVPFKGSLSEVIYQMIGGLRAGMGYCGAAGIDELMNAKFVRVTSSGITESHPHDVTITREAPNYSR